MDKLSPCPFCGGIATMYMDSFGKVMCSCDDCGMLLGVVIECGVELVNGWTAVFATEEEATAAWNRRTHVEN